MQLVIGGRLVVDVKMKGEIMDLCDNGVLLYVSICTEICVLAYSKILNMQVFSKIMSKYHMMDPLMSSLTMEGSMWKLVAYVMLNTTGYFVGSF